MASNIEWGQCGSIFHRRCWRPLAYNQSRGRPERLLAEPRMRYSDQVQRGGVLGNFSTGRGKIDLDGPVAVLILYRDAADVFSSRQVRAREFSAIGPDARPGYRLHCAGPLQPSAKHGSCYLPPSRFWTASKLAANSSGPTSEIATLLQLPFLGLSA